MKYPAVYILECRTGKFYIGVTSDLEYRLSEHEHGVIEGFTKRNGPCQLVWSSNFPDMDQAISFEKRVKGWRREKKIALIEGRIEDLPGLALPYNEREREDEDKPSSSS
ncbi:MAG: GIY-YIG nuclease family protein [Armatimonadetes bacterium]|nr:GIY-YIG nuclease family protein [Armatimonadota bacterium]